MNSKQIAEEAATEIVKARYSHENHFTVLVSNIIQAAIESAARDSTEAIADAHNATPQPAHASESVCKTLSIAACVCAKSP